MNESGKAMMVIFPTSQYTAEFVEPCKSAFNFPSPPVTAQLSTILGDCPDAIAFMGSNHFDTAFCQLLIERITVIGAIPNKSSGSSQGDSFIEGSIDKGDFMWASRRRVHGDWKTVSVCNNHELGAFAPLGFADFEPPFFATTKVPSIKHSAKLMPPRSSRSCASVSSIVRMTPSRTQREKRRKHVAYEGYRSGRSDQAAPVRRIHKTPFITERLSCILGRPRPSARRGCSGIRGSRIAHCSSVNSSLFAMCKS